jgi:cell wall-associated NlpC family hydrolase
MDAASFDALGGAITLIGGGLAKVWADHFRGAWGGRLEKQPPWWAMAAATIVCGLVGAAVAMWILGINPLEHLAALFTYGTTSTSTAQATTMVHNKVRPMLAPPQIPSVASEIASAPAVPEPDASAVEVPLQVASPISEARPEPTGDPRARILEEAASYDGVPYVWGGTKRSGVDCSGYTWAVMKAIGLPFPEGVRTAEQQRQFCTPVAWHDVQPGDLVFMHHTYEPDEAPGPDGFVASHIGIALGAGTFKMWDANNTRGFVGLTNLNTSYWQPLMLSAGRHPALGGVAAPVQPPIAASTDLVRGIDVASYQPTDLTDLIRQTGARHVVVKLYQSVERIGGRMTGAEHSRAQIASARANGCTVGGYLWGYAERDPVVSVRDALALAQSAGITLPILWLDIEPYTDGSIPSVDWIRAALAECEAQGVRGGIYSGAWVWPRLGNPSLPDVPLWTAIYDGSPALDVAAYGGMRLVGKQYGTTPCDTNVFLPEVCGV